MTDRATIDRLKADLLSIGYIPPLPRLPPRVYLDPPMARWERLVWAAVLLTAASVLTVGLIAWVTQ